MKTDIKSAEDIIVLVDTFYEKVNADALLLLFLMKKQE